MGWAPRKNSEGSTKISSKVKDHKKCNADAWRMINLSLWWWLKCSRHNRQCSIFQQYSASKSLKAPIKVCSLSMALKKHQWNDVELYRQLLYPGWLHMEQNVVEKNIALKHCMHAGNPLSVKQRWVGEFWNLIELVSLSTVRWKARKNGGQMTPYNKTE